MALDEITEIVIKRINGGVRKTEVVYIISENRIALWMGGVSGEDQIMLGSIPTFTTKDGWELSMSYIWMLYKETPHLINDWIELIFNNSVHVPKFTQWERL